MTSQLVIFRAFLFYFFRSIDPRSGKKSRKSTNKKKTGLTLTDSKAQAMGALGKIVYLNWLTSPFFQLREPF